MGVVPVSVRKHGRLISLVAAIGGVLLALPSLGGATPNRSAATSATTMPVYGRNDIKYCSKPTNTIKVGIEFELSGALQAFGQAGLEGTTMALREIGHHHGFLVGKKCYSVDWSTADTRSDPATAVAVTKGFIQDQGAKVIFGPLAGADALPTADISQANGPNSDILQFSPAGPWESTGLMGPSGGTTSNPNYPGLIRTNLTSRFQQESWAIAIKKFLPKTKSVFFLYRNDGSGQVSTQFSVPGMRSRIGKVDVQGYPPGTTDFTPYLLQFKQSGDDLLWISYVPADETTVTRQAVQLGITNPIGAQAATISIPQKDATGGPIANPFIAAYQGPELDDPHTKNTISWLRRYQAIFQHLPSTLTYLAFYFYDPVYMWVKGMQIAKSTNSKAVVKAMLSFKWQGVANVQCFNRAHELGASFDIAFVTNGRAQWFTPQLPANYCSTGAP